MDMESAKFVFQIAQFVLTCGVGFYVYMSNKDKVTNVRIDKLEEDLSEKHEDHGERLASLEAGEKNAIKHSDLSHIHNRINEVDTKVSTLSGKLDGVDSNLRLVLKRITERGMP